MADQNGPLASNRRARFNYSILDTFEAGMVLRGSEIKSLREGRGNISEAYVRIDNGEAWLLNAHIAPYSAAGVYGEHDPIRPRKLLLHRKELTRLVAAAERDRLTIVPLRIYIKNRVAKVLIGLAKGKQQADKRDTIRQRDAQREMQRAMKARVT